MAGPRVPFKPATSRALGTQAREADFAAVAPGSVPFRAARFIVEPGAESVVDQHAVWESWYIAEGRGELTYDGVRSEIVAGDVVLFSSQKSHQVRNVDDTRLVIFSQWWPASADGS